MFAVFSIVHLAISFNAFGFYLMSFCFCKIALVLLSLFPFFKGEEIGFPILG